MMSLLFDERIPTLRLYAVKRYHASIVAIQTPRSERPEFSLCESARWLCDNMFRNGPCNNLAYLNNRIYKGKVYPNII